MLKQEITDVYYDFTLIGDTLHQKYESDTPCTAKEVLGSYLKIANENLPESLMYQYRLYITSNFFMPSLLVVDMTEQFFQNLLDKINSIKITSFDKYYQLYFDLIPNIWLFKEKELVKHSLIEYPRALELTNGLAEKNLVDSSLTIRALEVSPHKKSRVRNKDK